jgi:hypothetical protein
MRVLLVPYTRDWSYDVVAKSVARHLGDEARVCYDAEEARADRWADVILDMWWRGELHRTHGRRVVKQVASHRWAVRVVNRWTPRSLLELRSSGILAVPSLRLHRIFTAVAKEPRDVFMAPKGFDPELFSDAGARRGELTFGWAGNASHKDKRLDILRAAEPAIRIADRDRPHDAMPAFYNGLDVFALPSDAEGDPKVLIEAMACGCFPVACDVGIVPELVRHRHNGLIVARSAAAFREAFAWCRANASTVREAGAENARTMRETRTWEHVAPAWRDMFESVSRASRRDASMPGR